jgi:phosphoribosylformylglycinamidine synthase
VLIDLGRGRNRLGGSILAQVFGQCGDRAPDLDEPKLLADFFAEIQKLNRDGLVLAYHDRSDGGLFATVCEMAFAAHAGVTVNLDMLAYDEAAHDVDGSERRPELMLGRDFERVLAALFSEELGAVIQIRTSDRGKVFERLAGLPAHVIGSPNPRDELRLVRNAKPLFAAPRADLERVWSELTFRMQQLRDDPACALEEFDRVLDRDDPGLSAVLSFDPAEDIAAPFIAKGARPKIAILREQGVNGHVEMAAAFDRAGFEAHDVHMSDIVEGRISLAGFKGFAAGGGFSYGDVLGAGAGWAKAILFNARARDQFIAFFGRGDTFALGACNGCQMMSQLKELIPGAGHWPQFARNRSEQFEARFVMAEVVQSSSIFFEGMTGSRMAIATAHGEGRVLFDSAEAESKAIVALRFVDHRGTATEVYPLNPNGSRQGVTGLTTPDGRFTVLMPHPERVFRIVQQSWHPRGWGEDSPWMRMFRNARKWVA